MTYDQLEMLEAVIKMGNYKAAAEHLHKSQPSLSVGIKKLEEEFGIKLFDRSGYRSQLTEQGKVFYHWARETLDSFRNLSVIGNEMGKHHLEPTLAVVIDPLIEFEYIQSIFETCLGPKSPTELKLRSEILGKCQELVLSEEAQFGIGMVTKSHSEIESFPFKRIEMIPVALKRVAESYKNFPQIIVTGPDFGGELSKGPQCHVSDHGMKAKLIVNGFGWGRLARHEIEGEFKTKKLVSIMDAPVTPFSMDLCVMRKKTRPLGPVAKKIWTGLKSRA